MLYIPAVTHFRQGAGCLWRSGETDAGGHTAETHLQGTGLLVIPIYARPAVVIPLPFPAFHPD